MVSPTNPFGPLVSLGVAFVSAVLDLLVLLKVIPSDPQIKAAVIAVLTAAVPLGLYLWATLHSWQHVTAVKMGMVGSANKPG